MAGFQTSISGRFWVSTEALDVRTERYEGDHKTICSPDQLAEFKAWLLQHQSAIKFVVTSVPFVGEARNGGDKWCGPSFRPQREEIIEFIASNRIQRLVFLTGDMHCSYHATMAIAAASGELTVHELMSSPINQFPDRIHAFRTPVSQTTPHGTRYSTQIQKNEFYGVHSNVMHVRASTAGVVRWDIYRTKEPVSAPTPVNGGTFNV